jgi:hypothetical protein
VEQLPGKPRWTDYRRHGAHLRQPEPDQKLSKSCSSSADLKENRAVIDQVLVRSCSPAMPRCRSEQGAGAKREDLEGKKCLIDSFFGGREVGFTVEFVSSKTKEGQGGSDGLPISVPRGRHAAP